MHHLDLYDVLGIAATVLQVETEAVIAGTDLDAVGRILDSARAAGDDSAELQPGDYLRPIEQVCVAGAVVWTGLVRDQPFAASNRRVAVTVLLHLAALNDFDLELEPVTELDELMDGIRSGAAGVPHVAAVLRDRIRERSAARPESAGTGQGEKMFERFSESARKAIVLAQEEARSLAHSYIGTEHLLLGLIVEGTNSAARALAAEGISATAARTVVLQVVGRGTGELSGHIPFTPRAKRVLDLTQVEAHKLGSDEFRPEHLLLGLLADGEGVAYQTLVKLGAAPLVLRRRITADAVVQSFATEQVEQASTGPWTTRSRGRHLLAELKSLLAENDELHARIDRLHAENNRLRRLLQSHDIDPDA
ncbi:ClpA/ClpB-like protein [Kribbella amoyensis]|uniref:ClpA/ClpB-like protein n=1 Tax=Kribbella amoyensis TaxID=996641 RepID=A0A561C0B3_9ACTN|nr:Clp protease N-terminal domain-containing protein [Kribbella amoyensis]TWD84352.1 ClpA/ClpB-like protein [Kribbella amoyensis]